MASPTCSDEEFIHHFEEKGAPQTAEILGVTERSVLTRRRRLEEKYAVKLKSPNSKEKALPYSIEPLTVNGTVVIFSDAHFWPGVYTDAFWILLQVIKEVNPVAVFDNGDSFDGARISRHARIGWDTRPSVKDELEANKICKKMIADACPEAIKTHHYGNHCLRLDTYLSSRVPEMEGIQGMSLKDHFPNWSFRWGTMVNENCVIKHRYKGGIGAGRNNTLNAGMSMVTGHDHHLQISRFSDYRGVRYGVQTGTIADIHGPVFDYTEAAPVDWQAGFIVGYFEGDEHWFEAVEVRNGKAMFGGRKWTP